MAECTYRITTRTGNMFGAGTDNRVLITLQGARGDAGPISLDNALRNDFERGAADVFLVKTDDVGEVLAVKIENRGRTPGGAWFLEDVLIECGPMSWIFMVYAWIYPDSEVVQLEATAQLPQKVTSERARAIREEYLVRRQSSYHWTEPNPEVPGGLAVSDEYPMPACERYRALSERNYEVTYAETMGGVQLHAPVADSMWDAMNGAADLLKSIGIPSVAERWQTDDEFARQALQGVVPVHIENVRALPEGMPFTDDDAYGLLSSGLDVAGALAARRMFLLDFGVLEGIPMYRAMEEDIEVRRWAPAGRALFFRRDDGHLRPVAIQLGRDAARDPVFTPKDSPTDWLAAKIYMRCAEGNVHQILSHALRTHFAMEPFVVATMRCLAGPHPVYKLMRRHFRYTLAINEGARKTLLASGGVFDEFIATGGPDKGHVALLKRAWSTWTLRDTHLPTDLARRGVDDPAVLPYYPYRDDALPLWHAMAAYVRETLGVFYESDRDLVDDVEMQRWWNELTTLGVPVERLPVRELTRVEDLAEILTTVMFTVSAVHSAVNNLQFEYYGFVPNAPLATHRPPPTAKGEFTERDVQAMMPSLKQSMRQIAIGRALATFGRDEEFLLHRDGWYRQFFREPEARLALVHFTERLKAQRDQVVAANLTRAVPYDALLADRVPCGITL